MTSSSVPFDVSRAAAGSGLGGVDEVRLGVSAVALFGLAAVLTLTGVGPGFALAAYATVLGVCVRATRSRWVVLLVPTAWGLLTGFFVSSTPGQLTLSHHGVTHLLVLALVAWLAATVSRPVGQDVAESE